ncbi:MAG: DNA polymerase [Dermatophilaceae bacterium]
MRRAVPRTVTTRGQLAEVAEFYAGVDEFVFDVETVGKRRGNPQVNKVTWLGLCHGTRVDIIPMGHPLGELIEAEHSVRTPYWDESKVGKRGKPLKQWRMVRYPAKHTKPPPQLWPGDVWEALYPAFFNDSIRKIGHNVKFDLETVAKYYGGIVPVGPYGDTLVLAHLLNSSLRYGLKDLTKRLYDHDYDQENIAKPDKNGENGVEIHAFSKVARYTALDVRYTWKLWKEFLEPIEQKRLGKVRALEEDVLPVLLSMEMTGVPVNVEAMEELGEVLQERLIEIEKSVFKAAGETFDLDSTPQKRKFVYETRGHKVFAWTAGGKDGKNKQPSTTAGVLEVYSGEDPAVADLLDYAKVKKLHSTYVGEKLESGGYGGGLLEHIVEGRIHADFVQYGADTGRFSCRRPNLQNIPRRAKDKNSQAIRKMFIADEGCSLVVADYSQIEYRVLAHFSGDPTLVKAFLEGYDPHAATMALLLDKALEDITPTERDAGKTTNFAEIYGAGPGTIAAGAGVSIDRAKWIKAEYRRRFPKVQKWKHEVVNEARRRRPPHVRTLTGRTRYLPALLARDDNYRFGAERQAVNTTVQGTAADIIKIAMIRLHHELEERYDGRAKIVLQVHDELAVMAPDEIAESVKATVQDTMEGVDLLRVPMEAEAHIGKNWAEAK